MSNENAPREYQILNSAKHIVGTYRIGFFFAEGDDAESALNRNLAKLREMFPKEKFTTRTV